MHPKLSSLRIILCGLLLALCATVAAIDNLTGRPTQIISGNELILLDNHGNMHRIRLSGIATQAPNQPWGAAARRHLQSLVMGRSVSFSYRTRDREGRIHGQLRHGGADINIRLLSAGLARLDPSGLSRHDAERYAMAEQRARLAELGIWEGGGREQQPQSRTVPGGPLFRIDQ